MDRVADLKNYINYSLNQLGNRTKSYTTANLTDWAIHSETFFGEILSLIFGCELKNCNLFSGTAATIDLADPQARIAVQVTVGDRRDKVEKTLISYHNRKLYEKYNVLYLIVVRNEPKKYEEFTKYEKFSFTQKDNIFLIPDLFTRISGLPIQDLQEIVDVIKSYFGSPRNPFLLFSDPWAFSAEHRKTAYLRYAQSFADAVENSIKPEFVDSKHPDPLLGELDIPLFAPVARLWLTRLKEFGVAFILDLSDRQVAALRNFIRELVAVERALEKFVSGARVNEPRDANDWAELSKAHSSLMRSIERLQFEFKPSGFSEATI